jgi:hypothetical protein
MSGREALIIGDTARVDGDTLPFRCTPGAIGPVRNVPESKAPQNEVVTGTHVWSRA